jgi:hypothetical protein
VDEERPLLADPYFNSWCGESLCYWETEQGSIRRVATWDTSDYGVELASTPSLISQQADVTVPWFNLDHELGLWDRPCLRITVLGNVQVEAEVGLELDFFSDGTVDYEVAVPGMEWQRIDLLVRLPVDGFGSLKVSLHKHGIGTAIFANVDLVGASECRGDPIELLPRKPGARCFQNADCESARCNDLTCSEPE